MNRHKVIIVSGPTASFKTANSIELALKLMGQYSLEIVNFDSLYFYKELNIGSAKPTLEERKGIPHHLIDVSSISHSLNAHDYIKLAAPIIKEILGRNCIPVLVGGSGFYLRALINGMYEDNSAKNESHEIDEILKKDGPEGIRKKLKEVDPESYEALHPNDQYRNTRALEYYLANKKPLSLAKKEKTNPYHLANTDYDLLHLYLDLPKEEHLKIIETRTQIMLQDGLISEIKNILKGPFTGEERPLHSVGNLEALGYIRGDIKDLDELKEKIIISTRQLAKAQRTFLKKITPKNSYHPLLDKDKILDDVQNFLRS